jgi:hypothetical protein
MNFSLGARYTWNEWKYNRPYVGLELSTMRLRAKGGEVTVTGGGDPKGVNESIGRVNSIRLLTGITHRITPGMMLDFNLGYTHASEIDPMGGVSSPGGFSAALGLMFLFDLKSD